MRPGSHSRFRFDPITHVSENLHRDGARLSTHDLCDDPFAHTVIDVTHGPPFSARGLPQTLSTARGAVALDAAAQGKILITSRADSGEVVFSDIQSKETGRKVRTLSSRQDPTRIFYEFIF